MQLTVGDLQYQWQEGWAKISASAGHSHHGLVIDKQGRIITGHASEPKILILDQQGNLLDEFVSPVQENHGICLAEDAEGEYLLIADNEGGQLVACDFGGALRKRITRADLPGYEDPDTCFSCTSVAWDPRSGDIWLSDGYGTARIFRFNADLVLQQVLTGSDEVGPFQQPHWVFVDTREAESRLYISDRSANRVQVLKTDGTFIKCLDQGLRLPSVFSTFGDYLVIGELAARLVLCDKDDNIIGYLGDGSQHMQKPGWPNRQDADGNVIPPADLSAGEFNSPHGVAADTDGNIYISEWLLGDRFIKLRRVS